MNSSTIYDVAKRAGVSLATVSRVVNNPEKVSDETKNRVKKAIKELGYHPNTLARGLATSKTTSVGVFLSDVSRASVAELLSGICDIAFNYNYSIKLFVCTSSDKLSKVLASIIEERIDGLIVLNDELDSEGIEQLKSTLNDYHISSVFANVGSKVEGFSSVSMDYQQAAYEITKELIEHGRKDIYLISTVRKYSVNDEKEAGYLRAIKEANLEEHIFRTSGDVKVNKVHFAHFFAKHKIDGAIAVRDSIAVSFMNTALNNGINIPQDLEITGFQNTKYALLANPNLTSVDAPVYDIGAVSMRLLTKLMDENGEINSVVLPYKIIKRESSK
jgi:LacI family transcriptional regulator